MNKAHVNFSYHELLVSRTVNELRKFSIAGQISLPTQMKKQQMLDYLLERIPDELPKLRKRLSKTELLLCEIVASAGGLLPLAEARMRLETETKRRKAKDSDGSNRDEVRQQEILDNQDGLQKKSILDRLIEAQVYGTWHYGWGDPTPVDLLLFRRELFADTYDGFYGNTPCLLMPKEARKYFEENPVGPRLLLERDSSKFEALRCVELPELLYYLLDGISCAASSKKSIRASPSLGRMPKKLVFPILQKYVAPTQVFQEVDYARFFEWYEVNAIVSEFAHFAGFFQQNDGSEESGLEVSTHQDVLTLLASQGKLCSMFVEWWASSKNRTRVIRRGLFDLAHDVGESEAIARGIISNIIRDEMKPGKWYSTESIVDRVRKDETGYRFDHAGIGRRGPQGTMSDACEEICKTMIAWPLLLFGIIETDGSEMERVRLGRWAAASTTGSSDAAGKHNNKSIAVTPNFEIILQPEARTLSFQLREFCESTESQGPAIILRITKSSVLRAFRTRNHTLEQLITFFHNLGVELPENVAHELNEWGRRYGEVELRLAKILECRDEAVAVALMADPTMRRHIVRKVGSTTLEVRADSGSEILSRCDSLGLLAKG